MVNYEEIGRSIGRLVQEKQVAYGDSYGNSGKVLSILFPHGVKPEAYTELLAICRVLDKLFRLANDPTYGGESPWADIVGYGLLRLGAHQEKTTPTPKRLDELLESVIKINTPVDAMNSQILIDSGMGC